MIDVRPVTPDLVGDAEMVFASSPGAAHCFCMWFVIPVTQYHAGGREQNRRLFCEIADREPPGLLAYLDGEPIGWCSAGPRSRYARAVKTPSFKGRDASEDGEVWLVPCFYVRQDVRGEGVARALLEAAAALAREKGAKAIEGFPFADEAKASHDRMVGRQSVFESCGFSVSRRPTSTRVVMRLEL